MAEGYKTLSHFAEFETVEKKSRFIGYAASVSCADEAEAFVAKIKGEHPTARHHVFAYTVGGVDGTPERKRMSDDGEPQGTGGMPCLDVLQKKGISCAAVVVVRYFGGILLGAPGLVRAYGAAAAGAADAAGTVFLTKCKSVTVSCDYQMFGKLSKAAEGKSYTVKTPVFSDSVTFSVITPASDADSFASLVTEMSNGKASAVVPEEIEFLMI